MAYEQIIYEVQDGVAIVTLNRPEKLNAMTARMGAELGDAMAEADGDDEVRAVVVTGAGRAFCAGADLGSGAGSEPAGVTPTTPRNGSSPRWTCASRSSPPSTARPSASG